ncbi:rod-determining factor RdfA [Halorubrum sp. AJ67]|uniref:rod-determining factor RdfA n=1 Tax=Halorubrum sp. AJ67 TaxID=1173487 RepID=UPI0003DBC43E|nr:rod-determining factor RdfA [Halorubrum sp. AJ67]CDK38600.1 uncharacterized protein BN903_275 [Halorubrum sp. AJ67]
MTAETSDTNTKVARVIRKYDLDEMGANLETAWTGESGERTSLRDLADEFNEAVLEAALREANVSSVSVNVSSAYDALRGESGSSKTRTRRHLEREGIDVDELTGDFVTHQAIHTYLTKEREASLPAAGDGMAERKVETIEKLVGRLSAVAESAISSLASADELDTDGYDVLVDVRAVCPHCGADVPIGELIRRGGCGCTAKSEAAEE